VTKTTTSSARAPRADARRNRDHILDVAEKFFAQHGAAGSLDAIAKQAGVGAGTLYRHFPTREALLAALLAARDDELVARREQLRRGSLNPADALGSWLDAIKAWANAFDGLPGPLRAATMTGSSPLSLTCEGFITTTEEFLHAAQDDGSARSDVRARDLFLSALAASWVEGAVLADDASAAALSELTRHGWASSPARTSDTNGAIDHRIANHDGQRTRGEST
jgi:AcrR family transcriptional regulator